MWLIHHGRKGQHWGELNGPPYPLDMTNKEYKKTQSDNEDGKRITKQEYKYKVDFGKTWCDKHLAVPVKIENKIEEAFYRYKWYRNADQFITKVYKKYLPKVYEKDKELGISVRTIRRIPK